MADEAAAWAPGSSDPKVAFEEFKLHLREITPYLRVVPVIVALNVLVFGAMAARGVNVLTPSSEAVLRWGADYGPLTLGGQPWRLLSSVFLHFGIIHLGANMLVLLDVGPVVERLFGPAAFAALYLTAGITGSVASTATHPFVVSAGASGAIFGIYGALGAVILLHRETIPSLALKRLGRVAASFIIYNLAFGVGIRSVDFGAGPVGIDNMAHLGGLVGGSLAGALLFRPLVSGRAPVPGRSLLVGVSALLVGAAAALALPRPLSFESIMRDFAATDDLVSAPYDALMGRLARGEIKMDDAAHQMENVILPAWRKNHAELVRQTRELLAKKGGAGGASPKVQLELELMEQAALARDQALPRMVAALKANDPQGVHAAGTEMSAATERAYGEIKSLNTP